MVEKILLAFSTFPDAETARRISNQLVTENFAACANILPAIKSIYRWKEKIETGSETLVFNGVSCGNGMRAPDSVPSWIMSSSAAMSG